MTNKITIIYLGILIAFLNGFDGFATNFGVTNNLIEESNPLMETLLSTSSVVFLGVKLTLSVFIIWICYLVYKRSKVGFQKFFSAILFGVSFMYIGIFSLHLYWISLL